MSGIIAEIGNDAEAFGAAIIGFFKYLGAILWDGIKWAGLQVQNLINWSFENPEKGAILWGSLAILYA